MRSQASYFVSRVVGGGVLAGVLFLKGSKGLCLLPSDTLSPSLSFPINELRMSQRKSCLDDLLQSDTCDILSGLVCLVGAADFRFLG